MKRAIIVHGWDGFPENHWFPWLKKKLEEINFQVIIPQMLEPGTPKIETWVSSLKKITGKADQDTFFVGHSIGCQTILRYLEKLQPNIKIGGILLVAGWVNLTPTVTEDEESQKIAKPWLKTPIDWKKIKSHCDNITAIFSNDDPFVPVEDAQIFKQNLNSKTIIIKGKGHFTKKRSLTEIPQVLSIFQKTSD